MTPESAQALTALMELPDPPELQHRGYHLTCEGDPDMQEQWLRFLPLAYVQHMRVPLEPEDEDGTAPRPRLT